MPSASWPPSSAGRPVMDTRVPRWMFSLALAGALALACASPEERFADHLVRGAEFADQGDRQKALLEYNSALKIKPDDADVNERVGDLLREGGAGEDAAFFYREAYRLDPQRYGAAIKEARLVLFSDPARAADILARVEKQHPQQSGISRARSELALVRSDVDAALAAAEEAAALAPDEPANWIQVSRAHQARVRAAVMAGTTAPDSVYQDALDALARAEVTGGDLSARLERAKVLSSWAGHRLEAEAAYRAATEHAAGMENKGPSVTLAADAAAKYARRSSRAELEQWALRQLVDVHDARYDAWTRLAQLAEDAQEGAGEAIFQELLSRRPLDATSSVVFANFLVGAGHGLDAIAHLEEVIEDGVESPILWEQLLRLQLRRLQLANARATFVRMADAFPDHPVTRRAEARLAVVSGRTAAGAEILRELVTAAESQESLRLLALAEYRLGNFRQASTAIDRALVLSGGFQIDAMKLKAEIHHDAGDWRRALAAYERMVTSGHKLASPDRIRRARALYKIGMGPFGRAVLLRLLAEEKPPADAAVQYAHREGDQDPEGARAYLEAAFVHAPTNYDVLRMLTASDAEAGKIDVALARLNQVVETRRVGPRVLLLRAEILRDRGSFDDAEADALRAFESAPDSVAAVELLYDIYAAQGKVAEARKSFEEAEAAGVLHSGARLLLGRLALHEGDTTVARGMFEQVVEEVPDLAGAKSDLALVLAEQGEDLGRALQLAQDAEKVLKKNAGAAHAVGIVYLESGRNEAALQQLRKALRFAERRDGGRAPSVHYHLGMALRALERNEEAVQEFESALTLDSEFPQAEDARQQLEGLRARAPAASSS